MELVKSVPMRETRLSAPGGGGAYNGQILQKDIDPQGTELAKIQHANHRALMLGSLTRHQQMIRSIETIDEIEEAKIPPRFGGQPFTHSSNNPENILNANCPFKLAPLAAVVRGFFHGDDDDEEEDDDAATSVTT